MYRLFDEDGVLLDASSSVADCNISSSLSAIKNEQPTCLYNNNNNINSLSMVAQESQITQAGYVELLQHHHQQQQQQQQQLPELSDMMSFEELRPRARPSNSDSGSSSGHVYHHHHHHHNHSRQQSYYNFNNVQQSPYSTGYFDDLEASATATAAAAATSAATAETVVAVSGFQARPVDPGPIHVAKQENYAARNSCSSNSNSSSNDSSTTTTTTTTTVAVAEPAQVSYQQQSSQHMETTQPQQQQQQQPQTTCNEGKSSPRQYHHQHHRHHHRMRNSQDDSQSTTGSESQHYSKKRRVFCNDGSEMDDQGDDSKSVRSNDDSKKQNHSEIEKRRRDKMNTYITELSSMVPMCHAMSRKLDKLTVLRMAVQHLKSIIGAVTSYTEGHYKPAFLSDQELKTLILQAAEGFVFVVGCDRGRILYVSKSVSQTLNYSQGDLLGQSWFDILHPKDVAKVKEQLSSSDLSPRERLIDAKTMLPVKTDVPQGVSRLCPGARRSFFCRMKRKMDTHCAELQIKDEVDTTTGCHRRKKQQNHDWKYCVIQCTGYLKSWAPAKIGLEEQESEADGEACNLSCLVAVGRIQAPLVAPTSTPRRLKLRTIEFISRHAMDGKFLFVDQRATLVLGFLPQELLGTSMYEYYHHDDIPHLAESHKAALQSFERVTTHVYRFRSKGASFVRLRSEWKSFKNPWTKDIEYLIAKNSAIFSDTRQIESSANRSEVGSVQENYDYFAQSTGGLERLISSHVEVSKIGRQIAEEVLDLQRRSDQDSSSSSSPTPVPEPALHNPESQITTTASPEQAAEVRQGAGSDNSSSNPTPTYNHINSNVQLSIIASDQGPPGEEEMMKLMGGTGISESPNPAPTDGNDEAAMAVIMSLLEADAGLGGPVDFSGLPWPLP